ncbi:hypothetical protein GEOBRER4_n1610 [Citrifermentans bremense]|uniref:Uncharacterized protein n=1 Tax=Citrifermentans bremense TaxID=60035 RepID=A0A6S6M4C4_9BACT|nr:hypothetical protein [Citrifermentans bremense]BCG46796.1 hypothetical protein GEOBRER4_n1610 [Citrifermentans bremense]
MFTLLESKTEIAEAQRTLERTMRREFTRVAVKAIGYPGGNIPNAKVTTNGSHWFWSADCNGKEEKHPRKLNWFGLFAEKTGLQISVEINIPYEGIDAQIEGFFGRDNNTGTIYLMHSGGVGGGRKGVGKSAFLSWSNQLLVEVGCSSGRIRDGVIVMPIEGAAATKSSTQYIDAIAAFKQAVRDKEIDTPEFQQKQRAFEDFYSESKGRRKGKRSSEIDYLSRHGEVVDAVKDWRCSLSLPKTARPVKNVLIDFGILQGTDLIEVYEVKTSTARQNVYSAIGQLMVHGAASDCRRVIVLPHDEPIADDLKAALSRLNIQVVVFQMDKVKTTILTPNLSK